MNCVFSRSAQSYYNIPDTQRINNWILTVRAYAINNDTYNIYNLMNGQLSGGNQLFDPMVNPGDWKYDLYHRSYQNSAWQV